MPTCRSAPTRAKRFPRSWPRCCRPTAASIRQDIDLSKPDYDVDVLIIGGGGAGASAAIEADKAGANVMIVTKLRMGDANTMMAEGGIQAADKPNDSPAIHYLDAFGGGHFAAKPELLYKLVTEAPGRHPVAQRPGRGVRQGARRHHDHHPRRRHLPQANARGQGLLRRGDHAHPARRGAQPRDPGRRLHRRHRAHPGRKRQSCRRGAHEHGDRARSSSRAPRPSSSPPAARARLHYQGFPTSNHYGATADGLILGYRAGREASVCGYPPVPSHRRRLSRSRSSARWLPKRSALWARSSSTRTARPSCIRWRPATWPPPPSSANAPTAARASRPPSGMGVWLDTPMIEHHRRRGHH